MTKMLKGKIVFWLLILVICTAPASFGIQSSQAAVAWPASDPGNTGGWIVNETFSDEFNGSSLNTTKWFNEHTYWSGRNPSQFDPSNVWISNGTAKLHTKNENLIKNGSFETGNLSNWSAWGSGTKSASVSAQYRDLYGVVINGQGAVQQIITGLQPNTTYKLSAWLKKGSGSKVNVGVKNYGGIEKLKEVTSSSWTLGTVEFTTGSTNTSAEVYVYNVGGSGVVYGDEVSVVRKVNTASGKTMLSDNYITSAVIQSKTKAPYGYYEVRMKAADASHTSSFWLQGNYSEIDVVEAVGNATRNVHKDTIMPTNTHDFRNGWASDIADPFDYQTNVRLAGNYHTYGVEWNQTQIKWYFDGQLIRTKSNSFIYENQYIFLDTEIFEWDGLPGDSLNSIFEVDYIRAWHK
ncbi:family 16 glycosylhydrolase [Paenibacillus sp. B01]|uniref:family 16 glycosylhydrolase n=1 Tax=Paenibacillus sp. B01 TaxID=2660554 RepID=UPI001E52E82E|nr:family 16 glycosylhydrolase [Paenibacillus sp. B01]